MARTNQALPKTASRPFARLYRPLFLPRNSQWHLPPCRDSEARKALEAQRVQDKKDALAAQRHESAMRRKMEMLAKNRMDSFLIDTLPQVAVAASDCIVRKRKP